MDNWKHRSEGMKCYSCMWFVRKPIPENDKMDGDTHSRRGELGRCRRHAPTMSGFPVVFQDDWCGDHKLNEEKI